MNLIYKQFELNFYNPKKSKVFAEKYLENAKKLNDKYHLVTGYGMVINGLDLYKGKKYLDTMMNVAKSYDKTMVTYTLLRKGQFFCVNRKLKEALQYYLLAYKNVISKNDIYLNHIKYEIAVVKSIMGKHQESLLTFLEMEKQLQNPNNIDQYVNTVYAISNTYYQLGEITNAEIYTNKGLRITRENKNYTFYQFFVSNRGKLFYKKRHYNLAIIDLENSLKTFNKINDFANFSENCFYLGKCYDKIKNSEKALFYFNKIDSVFNKNGYMFPDIINSYRVLIDESKNHKNIDKTLYYTSQLLKADSLIKQNYDFIINTTHKEYDVPELMVEKEILIAKMKTNSNIINSLFICFISIIFGLFWRYHKKRKNEITQQKELFDRYLANNELKIVKLNNEKIIEKFSNVERINEEIIENILKRLSLFEKEKHFKEDVTLDILAKKFETNTSYLSMVINKNKGCSFPSYINNLRIDLAIELLQKEKKYRNYSIKGLAYEVGFSSVQTFSRAFLAKTGVNASFFINELNNNNF